MRLTALVGLAQAGPQYVPEQPTHKVGGGGHHAFVQKGFEPKHMACARSVTHQTAAQQQQAALQSLRMLGSVKGQAA